MKAQIPGIAEVSELFQEDAGSGDGLAWTPPVGSDGAPLTNASSVSTSAIGWVASYAARAVAGPMATASPPAQLPGPGVSAAGTSLTFVNTFVGTLSTAYQNCILGAESFLSTVFKPVNSVSVTVSFDAQALGPSSYFLTNQFPYYANTTFSALKAALPASDVLPAADPGGSTSFWYVPPAYGRSLGLTTFTPPSTSFDSIVHLNSDYAWDFGQDVIAGLIHELSESVMGRVDALGQTEFGKSNGWTTMDLFRYNSSGAYDVTNGADGQAAFFSSDGGQTKSAGFQLNNQFGASGQSAVDAADWIGNDKVFGGVPPKSTLNMASTELAVMQALGWSVQMPQDYMKSSGSWQDPTVWSMSCMPIADPEDAYIGGVSNVVNATLGTNATVNSIGVGAGDSLEIQNISTLTAWNGTQINSATVGTTLSGNAGRIIIDSGSELKIYGVFNNSGIVTVGQSSSPVSVGHLFLGGVTSLALSGGGRVNLGVALGGGGFTSGVIETDLNYPTGLTNVDNTISGGGSIAVASLDNQAHGTVIASQSGGLWLRIITPTFTNEGQVDVASNATLNLGSAGVARTLGNSGFVNVGWDGASAAPGARLAISGNFTLSGTGFLAMRGAGAAVVSDGAAAATFINNSNLSIQASGQIGDVGVYNGVNDLTFINRGLLVAGGGLSVIATLNTGANVIDDGGGLLEAAGGATLNIKSNVTTGQYYANGGVAPPGGTVEAISGGKINLSAAISAGPAAGPGFTLAPGNVVVQYAGNLTIQSGGSVSTPLSIYGPAAQFGAGAVTVQSGGKLTGPVTFASLGAKLNLTDVATAVNATGKGGVVSLTNAKANLSGGSETVNFVGGVGNVVTLANTAGSWDTVNGSHGTVALNGAESNIVGGADVVNATAGSKLSLYQTSGAWDTVNGSGLQVNLTASEASIVGGAETIFATAGSKLSLYSTAGNWDSVNGSGVQINLTTAQASIAGGGDTVYANAGSSMSLFNTGGQYDAIYCSGDQIVMVSAQASILGGSNTIFASAGSSVSLYATAGAWDAIYGAGADVTLVSAQSAVTGGGNTIHANAHSSASLFGANGSWDSFYGSDDQVILTSAQATILGGSNTISATAGSTMSLTNTAGHADAVLASDDALILTNAQATLTGSANTISFAGQNALTLNGQYEALYFGAKLGLTSITGFNLSDVVHLSLADWANFSALQSSGDLTQSGANTLITLDAADTITLVNVKASTLTSTQFAFA